METGTAKTLYRMRTSITMSHVMPAHGRRAPPCQKDARRCPEMRERESMQLGGSVRRVRVRATASGAGRTERRVWHDDAVREVLFVELI